MRIVLDTNVLARAATGPPSPASELLLRCVTHPQLLCVSPYLLTELNRVLRYPRVQKLHGMSDIEIEAFVRDIQLASLTVTVLPAAVAAVVAKDPDDDPIVATAIIAQASYLCTRDQHLFSGSVVEYCAARGISVVSDIELLSRLKATAP
jgi:putative PIN family toxin of toxin-antitoxin system